MRRTTTSRVLADLVRPTGAFSPDIVIDITEFVADEGEVLVDFVVPVFNQAEIIVRNLQSIVESSMLANCVVVVVDSSTDETLHRVMAWADGQSWRSGQTRRVIVAATSEPVFETIADSVGIALTSARFIIEVQADMLVAQQAFDACLVGALEAQADLIAVSGRGTQPQILAPAWAQSRGSVVSRLLEQFSARWERVRLKNASAYSPSRLSYWIGGRVGRLGDFIDMPLKKPDRNLLYLGQTVMRGPLALRRSYFEELGGFDTARFFLGDDDHDLMLRAWHRRGYRCGYAPVGFSSPLADGSTRRERDASAAARYSELQMHYQRARSEVVETQVSAARRKSRRRVISFDLTAPESCHPVKTSPYSRFLQARSERESEVPRFDGTRS